MDEVKNLLSQYTTPDDIFKIAGKKCNVFTYPQTKGITSYQQLFKQGQSQIEQQSNLKLPFSKKSAIILYMTGPNCGHWTIINKRPHSIDFLDSYGDVIDDQLYKVDNSIPGQQQKNLLKLVKNYQGDVFYNDLKLQKLHPKIATCGRYCGLYLRYNYLGVDDFCDTLKKVAKNHNLTTDEVVCAASMYPYELT